MERLAARKGLSVKKRKADEACELDLWDVAFYSDLLKREDLLLDDEKLKEFFPLEGTIERILEVYSELLGLQFERKRLTTWHQEVVAFEVKEQERLVGHLFLDQFPRREGFEVSKRSLASCYIMLYVDVILYFIVWHRNLLCVCYSIFSSEILDPPFYYAVVNTCKHHM